MKTRIIIVIMILFVIASWGSAFYFFNKFSQKHNISKQLTIIPKITQMPKQVTQLIDTIAQKTDLPKDEMPSVATVTDINKLQDQLFFHKAKNGDKVLIYQNARKAVLYRPSTGEIVQVTPLIIITPGATTSDSARINASESASPVLRIQL